MLKKIIIFSFCTFILATDTNLNDHSAINDTIENSFSATVIDDQIQFGYSYSTGWSTGPFWIGIHCQNKDEIAGFQIELPENLQLLDAAGGRSEEFFSETSTTNE